MRQWGQFFFQEQEENLFLDSKIAHTNLILPNNWIRKSTNLPKDKDTKSKLIYNLAPVNVVLLIFVTTYSLSIFTNLHSNAHFVL